MSILQCARLGCPNKASVFCNKCETGYCKDHPPLTDSDPTTCDGCGSKVQKVTKRR